MRRVFFSPARLASLTLLASVSLAGCPVDPEEPGSDVVTPTDDVVVGTDVTTPPTDTPVVPPRDVPTPDVPTTGPCGISADVRTHVTAMATAGWSALNRGRGLLMHGCAAGARPQDCLGNVPLVDATNLGANRSPVPGSHLRLLFTSNYQSSYWSRSSPDGRFVAHGGGHTVDLTRGPLAITVNSSYDPGFFPDNSGVLYQAPAAVCPLSVLTTGNPTSLNLTTLVSSGTCRGHSIGLYDHLGASLGGSDYWAVYQDWQGDDGGHSATTRDPLTTGFNAGSSLALSLMANTGAGFTVVGTTTIPSPMQGDGVISPSSRLLVTRVANGSGGQTAYLLRRLDTTHNGSTVTATATELARYCSVGAKPAFSFDERWLIFHHYVGNNGAAIDDQDAQDMGFANAMDPGFAAYRTQGAANVYVVDLVTGARTRVTNMGPGQYALFPHFRSDGWIYFIVRAPATRTTEYIVASDAALVLP
jgi:hypothetical protein